MKKILFSLFALFFALCFTSCNDQASDSTESSIEEICNIPITSVEDFSLSDGKYEMIGECKDNSNDSNFLSIYKELIEVKTVDAEQFAESTVYYRYIRYIYINNTTKYEKRKTDYINNPEDNKLYEFNDESQTIIVTTTENYQDTPMFENGKFVKNAIKSILSGESEGSAKMNEDKTAFSVTVYNTEIGDITYTITKQD